MWLVSFVSAFVSRRRLYLTDSNTPSRYALLFIKARVSYYISQHDLMLYLQSYRIIIELLTLLPCGGFSIMKNENTELDIFGPPLPQSVSRFCSPEF